MSRLDPGSAQGGRSRGRRSGLRTAFRGIVAIAGLTAAAIGGPGCATPSLEDAREATTAERMGAVRQPGPPRRVLLISVAGLQAGDFLDARGHVVSEGGSARMPRLAALAREGVVGDRAWPPAPGSTYASHATLVTGLSPVRHGVIADTALSETGTQALPFWDNRLLKGTALWDAAIGKGVLALGWPTTVGARVELLVPDSMPTDPGVSWLDHLDRLASPRLVRQLESIAVEAGVKIEGAERRAPSRQAASATAETSEPSGRGERSPLSWPTPAERDAAFAELVCRVAGSERDPGLWLLRLSQTEAIFHAAGPGSAQAGQALARVDRAIGRIVDCLAAQGRLADTALFVVGDVAYRPVHTRVDPNVALVAAGLVGRDPRSSTGVRSWLALVRSQGRTAYVYARDATHALAARDILEAEAARTKAFRIVSAEELVEARADPQAWFGLSAAPGYALGNGLLPPALRPSERRAVEGAFSLREGSARDDGESAVGLLAWGRGIRGRVRIPVLELADVAPTIATLLGLRLDEGLAGRPLIGILRAAVPAPPPGPKRLGVGQGGDADRAIRELGGSRPDEDER